MKISTVDAEILHAGNFLKLHRRGHWEFVQRLHSNGAVFIVAVTANQELLLVEQMRVPVGQRTLELPAGIAGDQADDPHETAVDCALRELEEETGYRATDGRLLFDGPTAAGLAAEWGYFVLAENIRQVGAGGGVGDEDITVHRIPLASCQDLPRIAHALGLALDHRIYVALWWLQHQH